MEVQSNPVENFATYPDEPKYTQKMSLDFAVSTLKECAAKLETSNRPGTPDESFLISPVYN